MLRSSAYVFGLFLVSAVLTQSNLQADDVEQKFLPSGVTQRLGGYRPVRAEMDKHADIVKTVPEGLETPKFGTIEINDRSWAFILDEPEGEPARLYIDTNRDGDLTNDPETKWESRTQGAFITYNGEGQVDLGDGNIGALGLYRFDPKDPRRAPLKNTLMFYLDFGFEFTFHLDGRKFSTFVAGSPVENERLSIDRDGNGKISRNYEMATLGQPFNFTGSTYVLSSERGKLALERAAEELPQAQMPPDLSIGKPALRFSAATMDETKIDFPEDYAGRVVMLDFWATWCGPCIAEVPNMKVAYSDWHKSGFEILGISFDQEGAEDKIKEFLEKQELPWSQVYEGKFWDTTLGRMHDVSGIPFVLLVDGDSGEILATARELRGPGLSAVIGEELLKKKVGSANASAQYRESVMAFWMHAVTENPDLARAAYMHFARGGSWSDAARFGMMLVDQKPSDSSAWLNASPSLVLAGDKDSYQAFCGRMVRQFAGTEDAQVSADICHAGILLPGAVDPGKLPESPFVQSLETGLTSSEDVANRWMLRALLAYRRGDADSTLHYLAKSHEHTSSNLTEAQNLGIRALAEHQLGHLDEARTTMSQASELINALQLVDRFKGDRELLIAQILLREAQAEIEGKVTP